MKFIIILIILLRILIIIRKESLKIKVKFKLTQIMSSSGEILGVGVKRFPGTFDTNVAEVIAVRQTLIFTRDMSFSKVVIESDSKIVIDRLSSHQLDESYFCIVIEDCQKIYIFFEVISFNTHCDANYVAHGLAKLAQSSVLFFFYVLI